MAERIDAKQFGLTPKTHLECESGNHYILVIDRKSRLIMADGKRVAARAEKIRKVHPDCRISLRTGAPVCSKTQEFLARIDIKII